MKLRNVLLKFALCAVIVLSSSVARADVLPCYDSALQRIGYEVLVYVASAIEQARKSKGEDANGYRAEFIRLAEAAQLYSR